MVGCSQAIGDLLEYRGQTVVSLVAGSPKRITTGVIGNGDDLENGVVGWNAFESDTIISTSSLGS